VFANYSLAAIEGERRITQSPLILSGLADSGAKKKTTYVLHDDFRHTLATRSLKKWPTKVVSEILGHSDVHTTLRVYQHVETEDFRAPLNELADELLRDVTKSPSANPCSDDSKGDGAEART
jgi:integrase